MKDCAILCPRVMLLPHGCMRDVRCSVRGASALRSRLPASLAELLLTKRCYDCCCWRVRRARLPIVRPPRQSTMRHGRIPLSARGTPALCSSARLMLCCCSAISVASRWHLRHRCPAGHAAGADATAWRLMRTPGESEHRHNWTSQAQLLGQQVLASDMP